jgi:predicted RecA/RadA family phage recombinase
MTVARYTDAYYGPGKTLTLAAPHIVAAGAGAQVGSIFGVAKEALAEDAEGEFETEGEFNLTKVGSQAWAVGDRVYWDAGNTRCTTVATAGMFIGCATAAVASGAGDTTGTLKLASASELSEGPQAAEAALSGTLTGTANGSMVDIAATAAATVGGATPTAAQVDTGIALAVSTIVSGTNEQLKELQTKLNALLAKLVLAGILAP